MRQTLHKSRHQRLPFVVTKKGNARIRHPAAWDSTRRGCARDSNFSIAHLVILTFSPITSQTKNLKSSQKSKKALFHHHHRYERGRETKVLPTDDDDDGERSGGKKKANTTTTRRRVSLLRQVYVLRGIVSERHQEEKTREIFKYGGKR